MLAASPLHDGPCPGVPAKAFCTAEFAQKCLSHARLPPSPLVSPVRCPSEDQTDGKAGAKSCCLSLCVLPGRAGSAQTRARKKALAESHRPRLLTTRHREKRAHSCLPPRLPSDPALTKHRRGTELLVLPAFLSFLTPALLKEKSIA